MLDSGRRQLRLNVTEKTLRALRALLAGTSYASAVQAAYAPAEPTMSFRGDSTAADVQRLLDRLRDDIERSMPISAENLPARGSAAARAIRCSRDTAAVRYHREGHHWRDDLHCTREEVLACQRAMRGRPGMSFQVALQAVRRAVR